METYTEIKARHSKEFGEFPIQFAFSEKQLQRALEKLGAAKSDCMSVGAGSIIRKTDYSDFLKLHARHESEMAEFYKDDDRLVSAIVYELANHEYGYTMDPTDTISALGLDMADERIKACFQRAKVEYWEANKEQKEIEKGVDIK